MEVALPATALLLEMKEDHLLNMMMTLIQFELQILCCDHAIYTCDLHITTRYTLSMPMHNTMTCIMHAIYMIIHYQIIGAIKRGCTICTHIVANSSHIQMHMVSLCHRQGHGATTGGGGRCTESVHNNVYI